MKFINKNYIALAICIMVVGCKAPSAVESAAKTVVPRRLVLILIPLLLQVCSGEISLLIRTYKI
jgi:hypothetical protein